MDIIRAKEIIRTLADGVDPTTGEVLPAESVYNAPDVIRALFVVLEHINVAAVECNLCESPEESAEIQSLIVQDPLRNTGKPWKDIEDEKLKDEFASKMKISDIAKEHVRSYLAIESRLDHLGLKKKPFWLFRKFYKK